MATGPLISVKCYRHHEVLASRLWRLFRAKRNVDCDLNYCGRTVRLHRLLLDVLLLPDDQPAPPGNAGQLPEKDCLDMMVEFLYLGTVDVRESQLKGLLKLATESNFKMLVDAIQQAIKREQDKKNNSKKREIRLASKIAAQCSHLAIVAKSGQTTKTTQSVAANKGHLQGQIQLPAMPQAQLPTQSLPANLDATPTKQPVANKGPVLGPVYLLDVSQGQLQVGMLVPMANTSQNAPTNNVSKQEDSVSATKVKNMPDLIVDQPLDNQAVGASDHQLPVKSEPLTEPVSSDEHPSMVGGDLDMVVVTDTANQATYKCEVCRKQFAFNVDYQHHVRSHQIELDPVKDNREDEESFVRASCSSEYRENPESSSNDRNADGIHVDVNPEVDVTNGSAKKVATMLIFCNQCRTYCNGKAELTAHRERHRKERLQRTYPCDLCAKSYPFKWRLIRHQKIVHEKQLLKCDQCPKMLTSTRSLRHHKMLHAGKPFECNLCHMTFTTALNLRHHQNVKHLGEFVVCDKCGRKFNDRGNLLRHIETHSETKDHKCPECPKAYTNLNALRGHMVSHGEKRHACDHCDKKFFLKGNLNHHLKTHARNGIPSAQPKIQRRTRQQPTSL